MNNKLPAVIGLAKKAGAVAAGTTAVTDALRRGKAALVLTATDISAATSEKLRNKCAFYKTPLVCSGLTMDELSSAIGLLRSSSAVALTNPDFVPLIYKNLNNPESYSLSD